MPQAEFNLLTSEIARALDDPETRSGRLRELLGQCSAALAALVAENGRLRRGAHDQFVEIAAMIGRQEVAWPEDVARHEALVREIRRRAELFAAGYSRKPWSRANSRSRDLTPTLV